MTTDIALKEIHNKTNQLFASALSIDALSKSARDSIKNTKVWVDRFEYGGDLLDYLQKFKIQKSESSSAVLAELSSFGLSTFESIYDEIFPLFANFSIRRWAPSALIPGKKYSAHQIAIYARKYTTRQGIYVVEHDWQNGKCDRKATAVLLRATIDGGKYGNGWLKNSDQFRYYLFGRTENTSGRKRYDVNYHQNRTLLDANESGVPIFLFTKTNEGPYVLIGQVSITNQNVDPYDSYVTVSPKFQIYETLDQSQEAFEASILDALNRAPKTTTAPSASNAPPSKVPVVGYVYDRDPKVVADRMMIAKGKCDACGQPGPFTKLGFPWPFLEVHHLDFLSEGGLDVVENTAALCPNCHRTAHLASADIRKNLKEAILENRNRDAKAKKGAAT